MNKRSIFDYVLIFIIFINCFSFINAGSVPLDVSIKVIEKVEQGDIVEILNKEFENERAEVMGVNEEGEEAIIRLLDSQDFLTMSLNDLNVVEKVGQEEGLAALKLDKELISRLLAGVIVVLIILLSKRKEKKKKKVRKRTTRKRKR